MMQMGLLLVFLALGALVVMLGVKQVRRAQRPAPPTSSSPEEIREHVDFVMGRLTAMSHLLEDETRSKDEIMADFELIASEVAAFD
jgi:hypothetical protein